ncbi:hypothetical protein [Luteolibacter luteus]|uniref:Verru_Chthon cassette protein A n=1 Tax=Luteolibacter luteus TaxID=2728835 RepID=A0A858RPL4_9BACT|nr:hypothetical protein [Luteolibacter luteus]QJE98802.1 hypothetical protein HHL09_24490 [Luteolibacter luteus]
MKDPILKCVPARLSFPPGKARKQGFALVVALLLMAMLSVLAIGLLSLSNIALRTSSAGEARRVAQANARMALALAIGKLQSELGDDRRITADAAIIEGNNQPYLTGVWDSAAGTQNANPLNAAPDYDSWKKNKFRTWLASTPDPESVKTREFANKTQDTKDPLLFSDQTDGFEMRAASVEVDGGPMPGAMAWAVSQEGTKAKINVGTDVERYATNDAIQAPAAPNLELSGIAAQPGDGFDRRRGRVLGIQQAVLDSDYKLSRSTAPQLAREHTAHAKGVLSDVVKGGLKTDFSLGFELGNQDFNASRWGQVSNPFGGGSAPGGEVPLFQPINGGAPVKVAMNYGSIAFEHNFESGAPATFNSLRSHYNLYRHLYRSNGMATAFYRPQGSTYWPNSYVTRGSETSVTPVLDRVLFFVGLKTVGGVMNVVFTPVVTLWNPYNVAIEAEGFAVYPWMDLPLVSTFTINNNNSGPWYLTQNLGANRKGDGAGRQSEPYFMCYLTGSGTSNTQTPLRLGPGEVRVFVPADKNLTEYDRVAPANARTNIFLKPVASTADMDISGGIRVPMNKTMSGSGMTQIIAATDTVKPKLEFLLSAYHYFVTMEDLGRLKGLAKGETISEIQVYSGKVGNQTTVNAPTLSGAQLSSKVQVIAMLETFHRTAGQANQMSDLVFTVNPRQRYINGMISGATAFAAGPHYESSMRETRDYISSAFQVTGDGRRSFYGMSNAPSSGRDYLSFFEVPQDPMLSLAGFQHADLSDSAFGPGSQFANAWASPYLARNTVARRLASAPTGERISPTGIGIYDQSYLLNSAVWDSFFLSSIAPRTTVSAAQGSPSVYDNNQDREVTSVKDVINNWVGDPEAYPLRNQRYQLHRGGLSNEEIVDLLSSPSGCRQAAAHLLVDGAFNVNSVNPAAWKAMLASLRGATFDVESEGGSAKSHNAGDATPTPRQRRPFGSPQDLWNGFRELSDAQIESLAEEIVKEVKSRGPFQSLGEFVNRRLTSSELGLKGALQAAIDRAGINKSSTVASFVNTNYPYRTNIPEPYTGTGTPGWLTQADLLNALGPYITVRSDTFTVRAYGEARDDHGNVLARSWCEAVVQRVPEWVDNDPADNATELPEDLTPTNAKFGRRFEVVSFRELSNRELES